MCCGNSLMGLDPSWNHRMGFTLVQRGVQLMRWFLEGFRPFTDSSHGLYTHMSQIALLLMSKSLPISHKI